MVNKIITGIIILCLFASIYISISLQKNPVTLHKYAAVLGTHVKIKPLPTLGPMVRIKGASVTSPPLPSPIKTMIQYETMWNIIQNWRSKNGLPAYQISDRLCQIAQQRLTEIQNNWSHEGFTWQRFCPDEQCILSENLARKYTDEQKVLEGWLRSPPHAENLYKPYQFACLATDGNYIVHIMGNL